MNVYGIEIRDRPKRGVRAFDESEDQKIYEVLALGKETTLKLAVLLGVQPNTIIAAKRRASRKYRRTA